MRTSLAAMEFDMNQLWEPTQRGPPLKRAAGRGRPGGWRSLVVAGALLCLGCGSEPAGPLDPALTGTWSGPLGVDTHDAFILQQRGALVTGTHDFFSAVFRRTTHMPVSGTVDLPRVVLRWGSGNEEVITTGTLSPDSMSLTVTDSVPGGRGQGPPMVYTRIASP